MLRFSSNILKGSQPIHSKERIPREKTKKFLKTLTSVLRVSTTMKLYSVSTAINSVRQAFDGCPCEREQKNASE
jgi:hypothetical protein